MDPKWNPITLMIIGTVLLVVSYFTSLWYVRDRLQATIALIVMAVSILTLASGVVLAFFQTFRERPDRLRFRR